MRTSLVPGCLEGLRNVPNVRPDGSATGLMLKAQGSTQRELSYWALASNFNNQANNNSHPEQKILKIAGDFHWRPHASPPSASSSHKNDSVSTRIDNKFGVPSQSSNQQRYFLFTTMSPASGSHIPITRRQNQIQITSACVSHAPSQ